MSSSHNLISSEVISFTPEDVDFFLFMIIICFIFSKIVGLNEIRLFGQLWHNGIGRSLVVGL